MVNQLSPHEIKIDETAYSYRNVCRQMARLVKEGQIEPILLNADHTIHENAWTYATAQVMAARELNWDTLLVTYTDDSM